MEAILKAVGGTILLFFGYAIFIIIAMAIGRLLDKPALERWFYGRVHSVVRMVRHAQEWRRKRKAAARARSQDS